MKEADLHQPIQTFFEKKGFVVQGEVNDCDIAMIREDELVLIELKLRFNLELLFQAVDRQTISSMVYIAIPRPASQREARYKNMMALIRRLDLGLIFVALDSPMKLVEIVRVPQKTPKQSKSGERKSKIIKAEIENRQFNLAVGGVRGEKIPTAYREQSILVLCTLEQLGQCSPVALHELYGCPKKVPSMLSANYHRWFSRVERGIYEVSEQGLQFLEDGEFREIVAFYRQEVAQLIATQPVVTKPVSKKPVPTQPVATKPVSTKPASKKPIVTKQITKKPVVTKPNTKKPAVTQPVVTKPNTKKPAVTKQITKKPVVTKPNTKKPAVTKPNTKKPTVTKKVATQPAVTKKESAKC